MRSTVLVTTAVLALGLSTIAHADDRDRYRDRDRDRYEDRYDDRYQGRSQSNRVSSVAYEIERTAASIQREYDRNNRRPDRNEARVSSALRELYREADQFHRGVQGYRDSRRDDRGYDGLRRAFDEAASSLERIRSRPYVDRGMERIWSLMSELDRYYGRSDRDNRDNRYRGRYGRDRYDN